MFCLEKLASFFPEALSEKWKCRDDLPFALPLSYLGSSLVNAIGSRHSSFPLSYYPIIVRIFAGAWTHAVMSGSPSPAKVERISLLGSLPARSGAPPRVNLPRLKGGEPQVTVPCCSSPLAALKSFQTASVAVSNGIVEAPCRVSIEETACHA